MNLNRYLINSRGGGGLHIVIKDGIVTYFSISLKKKKRKKRGLKQDTGEKYQEKGEKRCYFFRQYWAIIMNLPTLVGAKPKKYFPELGQNGFLIFMFSIYMVNISNRLGKKGTVLIFLGGFISRDFHALSRPSYT